MAGSSLSQHYRNDDNKINDHIKANGKDDNNNDNKNESYNDSDNDNDNDNDNKMKKMIRIDTMPTTMTMTAMITRTIMIITMIMIIINHNYKIFFDYSRLLVLRKTQKIIRHEKEGGRPERFWQGRADG